MNELLIQLNQIHSRLRVWVNANDQFSNIILMEDKRIVSILNELGFTKGQIKFYLLNKKLLEK